MPLYIKGSTITKQGSPNPISDGHLNMEALVTIFEPFTDFGEAKYAAQLKVDAEWRKNVAKKPVQVLC